MIRLCKVVRMSRQNYYKQRCQRQRHQVDEGLVLSLVRRERAVQPKLGTRKLKHLEQEIDKMLSEATAKDAEDAKANVKMSK